MIFFLKLIVLMESGCPCPETGTRKGQLHPEDSLMWFMMQDDKTCNLYFIVWLWDFTPGSLCPSPLLQQDAPLIRSFSACQQVDFSWFPRKKHWQLAEVTLTQLRCESFWSQKSGSGSFPETGCSLLPDFSVNYSFVFWIELLLQFFWLWLYSECSRKISFHQASLKTQLFSTDKMTKWWWKAREALKSQSSFCTYQVTRGNSHGG